MKAVFAATCAVYAIAVVLLFLFLNRGRMRSLHILLELCSSLLVGFSMIVGCYFRWVEGNLLYAGILWIASFAMFAPYTVSKWVNTIKGRESPFQAVIFSIALVLFYSTLFLPPYIAWGMDLLGFAFLFLFFRDVYRYPFLNEGWLNQVIDESAREVPHTGRYSPKPVIINSAIGKRFLASSLGLSLLAKDQSTICRISSKRHQRLGSPNLEEFFTLLCGKIKREVDSRGP